MAQRIVSDADRPILESSLVGSVFALASNNINFIDGSLGMDKLVISSGIPASNTFVRGDSSWQVPPMGGAASGALRGTFPNPSLASGSVGAGSIVSVSLDKLGLSGSQQPGAYVCGNNSWAVPTMTGSAGGSLTGTFPNPSIAAGAIQSSMISDGSVTVDHIQAVGTKQSSSYLSGTGSWDVITQALSGGAAGGALTGTYPNPSIAAGVINSDSYFADNTIAHAKLATLTTTHTIWVPNYSIFTTSEPAGVSFSQFNLTTPPLPVSGSSALPTNSLTARLFYYRCATNVTGQYQCLVNLMYEVPVELNSPVITGITIVCRTTVASGSGTRISARVVDAATDTQIASLADSLMGGTTQHQTFALTMSIGGGVAVSVGQILSIELYPYINRVASTPVFDIFTVTFTYSTK